MIMVYLVEHRTKITARSVAKISASIVHVCRNPVWECSWRFLASGD